MRLPLSRSTAPLLLPTDNLHDTLPTACCSGSAPKGQPSVELAIHASCLSLGVPGKRESAVIITPSYSSPAHQSIPLRYARMKNREIEMKPTELHEQSSKKANSDRSEPARELVRARLAPMPEKSQTVAPGRAINGMVIPCDLGLVQLVGKGGGSTVPRPAHKRNTSMRAQVRSFG